MNECYFASKIIYYLVVINRIILLFQLIATVIIMD